MTSTPAKTPAKKGGWGSLLSGAVAGLESRLDTILADDSEASARSRAADQATKDTKASQPRTGATNLAPPERTSRDASRSRVNDRLAERLAKATAVKTQSRSSSATPSRVDTPPPPLSENGRSSIDSRRSGDWGRSAADTEPSKVHDTSNRLAVKNINPSEVQDNEVVENETIQQTEEDGTLAASRLPLNPAKLSMESSMASLDIPRDEKSILPSIGVSIEDLSSRPSIEIARDDTSPRPSSELPNGNSRSVAEIESEMMRMLKEQAETEALRQEEMQTLLEKVDALQAKLQYLAKETVAAAKEANASTPAGSPEHKLAEKDEKIALLMEEGEKLSKTELRHLQTIRKLRVKIAEDEKANAETRRRLDRIERSEADLKSRLRRAEAAERQANDKTKHISSIESRMEQLRAEKDKASDTVQNLTAQLKKAEDRADRAEKEANSKAAEIDRNKIASLENDLEDAKIEKKLADDHATSEIQKLCEDSANIKQRFSVRELELKNEIASLDSKLEAVRSRAEEASADGSTGGEGNIKLIRQVETLQSQYSLAKENWETIEGSLNARLAAMEKERDESLRRETEVRRKARDVGLSSRKANDELERAAEKTSALEAELQALRESSTSLRTRHDNAQTALDDARAETERQRKIWDAELSQRLEEEKLKWMSSPNAQQTTPYRVESPTIMSRKTSTNNVNSRYGARRVSRLSSSDLLTLHSSLAERPPSRRSPAIPPFTASPAPSNTHDVLVPGLIRHESTTSLDAVPSPVLDLDSVTEAGDLVSPMSPSPERTIGDFVSHSTAAGPSVQLVERMSAAVRRLESEKAAFKDELARLAAQRDAARDDVVGLMREVDEKRASDRRGEELDVELRALKQRYNGALELLGEREEEVEELRGDVGELKRIYRELVERKVGPEVAKK